MKDAESYSMVYDGTPKIAEVLAVIICFVRKSDRTIQLRAVTMKLLDASLNGDQLAAMLTEVVQYDLGINRNSLR